MEVPGVSAVKQPHSQTECVSYSRRFAWRDGIRLVDLGELAKQLRCRHCSCLLDLNNTQSENRVGLASVLSIQCCCGKLNDVRTGKMQETGADVSAFEINMKVSMNMLLCGVSGQHVINFLAILDVPLPGDTSSVIPPTPSCASPSVLVPLPGEVTASPSSSGLFHQHGGAESSLSSPVQNTSQRSLGYSTEVPIISSEIKEETVEEMPGVLGSNACCNNGEIEPVQAGSTVKADKPEAYSDGSVQLPDSGKKIGLEQTVAVSCVLAQTGEKQKITDSSVLPSDPELEESEMPCFFDSVTDNMEVNFEAVQKAAERKYYRCPMCPRVLPSSRGFIVHVSRMHHATHFQAEHYELGPNCGYTGDKAQDAVGEDAIPTQATDSLCPEETEGNSLASDSQQKTVDSADSQAAEDTPSDPAPDQKHSQGQDTHQGL